MTETTDFPQEPSLQKLGRYEIRAELGRGGFATVYRALDPNLDREVALKVLHPQLLVDRNFVARFRKEARALANLRHAHIVTVYEVSEADGRLFIAMELAQGPSLAKAIEQRGRIPWAEALDILRPVCTALDYAHGQGIVHRDLKPGNILLDKERGPLLTDFGLARIMGGSSMSVSISGGIVGTPAYIAPEVWEEEAARPAADIYALGCVFYEMVTGALLFNGATPMHIMRAHDKGPQFAAWPAETPPGLDAALRVALAAEPGARYPSGEAFWHALNDVEANAQAAREQAEREAAAAQWQAEAEQAMAEGEWGVAKKAVGRWLKLTPESEAAQAARRKIEGQEAREQEARSKKQEEEEAARQAREAQEREAARVAAEEEARRKRQEEEEARKAREAQERAAARIAAAQAQAEADRQAREAQEREAVQLATGKQAQRQAQVEEEQRKNQLVLTLAPNVKIIFAFIPAGQYPMDSTSKVDKHLHSKQQPQHKVYLDMYWIGKSPVTNAQYHAFVEATKHKAPKHWKNGQIPVGEEQYPVVYVSWKDATAFCKWATQTTGQVIKLPTEAEWEKAVLENCTDMDGNVWEWTANWYGDYSPEQQVQANLTESSPGIYRVLRGGASCDYANDLRAKRRHWNSPSETSFNIGFRCLVARAQD